MTLRGTVSVIIPTHRDRGFLGAALRSVVPQLRGGDEVLICANGCDPAYLVHLQTYVGQRVALVVSPRAGIANARNFGVANSTSSYLLFLDDDDELLPDALTELRRVLDADGSVAAVTGEVRMFRDMGECDTSNNAIDLGRIEWSQLLGGPPTPTMGSSLIRRAAFARVGGLDETVAPADDWDLWLKLASDASVVGLRRVVLRYRLHSANASGNVTLMIGKAMDVYRRHEHRGSTLLSRRVRLHGFNRIRRWYTQRLIEAGKHYLRNGDFTSALRMIRAAMSLNAEYAARLVGIAGMAPRTHEVSTPRRLE